MANTKITELTAVTALAGTDVFPVVDVSASTTNKVSVEDLLRNAPDGTEGAPSIANAGDQDTGILFPADNSVGVSTGGTQRLVINSSGRLGIGTSSPTDTVELSKEANHGITLTRPSGGVNPGSCSVKVFNNGKMILQSDHDIDIRSSASNNVIFRRDSTESMRIDSSGRLLLGTTAAGDGDADELTLAGSGNSGLTIRSGTSSSGNIFFSDTTSNSGTGKYDGYIQYRHGDRALLLATAATERLRIDSSGRVLVGTSSARNLGRLEVEGTTFENSSISATRNVNGVGDVGINLNRTRGTTAGSMTALIANDRIGSIVFRGADGTGLVSAAQIKAEVDGTPGSNAMPGRLVFSTSASGSSSPTERMRITSAGRKEFYNDSGNSSLHIRSSSTSGTADGLIVGAYGATAGNVGSGTNSFIVYTNGNVVNTNNSYGAISDAKLKENIVDASSQWEDIKDIRVRNYNFIEGQTHTQIGVVAQEVETVSPGLVTESLDIDGEGNDLGTTTKSVNYSVLYMKAVKALQEAMDRIETLEAKVAALEAQ